MLMPDEEFHRLMEKVLDGSETAAHELFDKFGPLLIDFIRRRLIKRVRSQFDSMDVAQDVWTSFFKEAPLRRTFTNQDHLLAFLTTLARNKVVDVMRKRLGAKKYNVNREMSMDDSCRFDKNALAGRQQTPSQILVTKEAWVEFLRKQPPVYRHVFILLEDGKRPSEIAQEIGITERTVRRIASRLMSEGAA
jgi:RNA polymerase sigma factor (sigma-70 family)